MLDKDRVVKNIKHYFATGEKYGFMTKELMDFLGADFMEAPASTMSDLHNAFEGGLVDHTLRVTKYAFLINDVLPKDKGMVIDVASLIKVCCLHQIGKAKLYKPCLSECHRTNQGKMYEFVNDSTSMSVGERSVKYAMDNGVTFTDDEYQAILNFSKDDTDKQANYHSSMLGTILKQAIQLAIAEEQINHKISLNNETKSE